jgi:hypothetical protein
LRQIGPLKLERERDGMDPHILARIFIIAVTIVLLLFKDSELIGIMTMATIIIFTNRN